MFPCQLQNIIALVGMLTISIFAPDKAATAAASAYDFSYSGRVVDKTGKPFEGPIALKVSFFHSASSNSSVPDITSGLSNVALSDGIFQITMALDPEDFHTVFPSVGQKVYIQITDLTHGKTYDRQQISMLPYAGKVPVDTGVFDYDSNGLMTFASPPESGKFLKANADGSVSWDSPAGGVAPSSSDTFTNKTIDADNNTITDISDANIKASAAIADSKLATISTAGKVSGAAITSGTIAGSTAVSTTGDITTTGRVGVGAAAGTSKLEVTGGGATSATSAFNVMNSTPTSLLFVRNDGNVGIGTTSPSQLLHINGGVLAIQGLGRSVAQTISQVTDNDMLIGGHFHSGYGIWPRSSDGSRIAGIGNLAGALQIIAGSSERIRISSSGNVGIGTTSPQAKLHVEAGAICVSAGAGSNDCSSAANTAGTIFAVNTTVQGADYAEYFESEGDLVPGDIIGINPRSGLVRRYHAGDKLVGVASTQPGVIGNSKIKNKKSALVALMGQVPFDRQTTQVDGNVVKTSDGAQIGYILASGDLYLHVSSSDKKFGELVKKVSDVKAEKDREIALLKSDNETIKADNVAMREVLCEMKPEAVICN